MTGKEQSAAWRRWLKACLLQFALLAGLVAAQESPRVLVLLSYHHGYTWEDRILDGFEEWGGVVAGRPALHVEWMDTKRHPDPAARQRFAAYLKEKHAGRRFDLLVAVDDNALEF
ncbi:MAG TPA: hypothetical protein PLN02_04040, partial [Azonexus sp.]|nr:hypothetical protein [Azonexus sp.]